MRRRRRVQFSSNATLSDSLSPNSDAALETISRIYSAANIPPETEGSPSHSALSKSAVNEPQMTHWHITFYELLRALAGCLGCLRKDRRERSESDLAVDEIRLSDAPLETEEALSPSVLSESTASGKRSTSPDFEIFINEPLHATPTPTRIASEMAMEMLAEIIQNELPAHVIDLSRGMVVGRDAVRKATRAIIRTTVSDAICWGDQREDTEKAIRKAAAYVILSHRWLDDGELTFGDDLGFLRVPDSTIDDAPGQPSWKFPGHRRATSGPAAGRRKLQLFCKRAKELQPECRWAWVDTCCIDKRSSAELDESIRSMFKWYMNAEICLVYLAETRVARGRSTWANLEKDSWFFRGWTLQELLAPRRIKFFDAAWEPLTGDENDKFAIGPEPTPDPAHPPYTISSPSPDIVPFMITDDMRWRHAVAHASTSQSIRLLDKISEITEIPKIHLLEATPSITMVREKMRWASKRTTTRVEDMAYCLISLFDVDVPIAYGEGERAFFRLQKAIAEQSPWVELLIWCGPSSTYNSMFASSPRCFVEVESKLHDGIYQYILETSGVAPTEYAAQRIAKSIIPRGPPTLTMINGRLGLELVMYPVSKVTARPGKNVWEVSVAELQHPVVAVSEELGLYYAEVGNAPTLPLTLGILDYELDDARGRPNAFIRFLITDSRWRHALPSHIEEAKIMIREARVGRRYVAILLYQRIPGEDMAFSRLEVNNILLVNRPMHGWEKPQSIQIGRR